MENPTPKPAKKIELSPEIQEQVKNVAKEGQTIVHCSVVTPCSLRIWKTTRLQANNGKNYKLVHAENISIFPKWTKVNKFGLHSFTLYFEPLDKDVVKFDLEENIPQPGGFSLKDIKREKEDIYHVSFV